MGSKLVQAALIACGTLVLAGCGFTDSYAPVPGFMRGKAVDPPPAEPPPDVRQLVRNHLESVFVAASNPRDVRVTPPLHVPNGLGWTACVRAELTSATGRPLGPETYRITISGGVIIDRRLAEDDDNCPSESFEPI
jgi:hypothetical protein